MPVKIVLADDQHLTRKACVALLQLRPDFEVCAQAANGADALRALKFHQPDILLLDLNMPVMDGFEVLETLQKENAPVKTIVVSMLDNPKTIGRCWELGMRGFLSTFNEEDEEQTAIDSVMKDGYYFNGQTSISILLDLLRLKRFKPRFDMGLVHFKEDEMRILTGWIRGLSIAETGNEICASISTVERKKER